MSYITLVFNHFRAIQRWSAETGGRAKLDASTFALELKLRNRYFHLYPQFIARRNGKLCNVASLTPEVFAFAGWLPYRPYSIDLATDKLLFKEFFAEAGLKTPAWWPGPEQAQQDFVLKRSVGSYGLEVAGPFRTSDRLTAAAGPASNGRGVLFAEAFVNGQILKVWFWGAAPFFTHVLRFPSVSGDGARTLSELARELCGAAEVTWPFSAQAANAEACVRYQGLSLDDVLDDGRRIWVDFRYGHRDRRHAIPDSDDASDVLTTVQQEQVRVAGETAGKHLLDRLSLPLLYTLDGLIDDEGAIWWIEMNSNPALPPEGYDVMSTTLFA